MLHCHTSYAKNKFPRADSLINLKSYDLCPRHWSVFTLCACGVADHVPVISKLVLNLYKSFETNILLYINESRSCSLKFITLYGLDAAKVWLLWECDMGIMLFYAVIVPFCIYMQLQSSMSFLYDHALWYDGMIFIGLAMNSRFGWFVPSKTESPQLLICVRICVV